VLAELEGSARIQRQGPGGRKISLADLIVLAGGAAIEKAAEAAGQPVSVPFAPGRTMRRRRRPTSRRSRRSSPSPTAFATSSRTAMPCPAKALLVDKAQQLTLSAPEMTVLVGGLRVLGVNAGGSTQGVFTEPPGVLTNDFFVNLLDMRTEWQKVGDAFVGRERTSGTVRWTGSRVDLVFGSNAQLRAIAEVYAAADAKAKFVADFVAPRGSR
jgi:catalase-peroxidase